MLAARWSTLAQRKGADTMHVSSTFSNDVVVVGGDPNNDGNPEDASIAGRLSLVAAPDTKWMIK
jgi:hypothetical protein